MTDKNTLAFELYFATEYCFRPLPFVVLRTDTPPGNHDIDGRLAFYGPVTAAENTFVHTRSRFAGKDS